MVQWQEYPPATSVARVQIPVMTPTMSEMSLFLILSLTLSGFLWLLQFFSVLKNQEWYTKNHYVYVDMLPLNHYLYSLLLSKVLLYAC